MNTMFLVQSIPVQGSSGTKEALVFFDKGSNVSMIRDEMANKLGLEGLPVKQKLIRSGADVMDWETKAYKVPLIKKDGGKVIITAMGFPEISSEIESADVGPAMNVFPQIPSISSIRRPSGKVDLLIGLNCMEVQPKEVAREKNLSLWESDYGTGYLLGGTHPNIWLGGREALVPEALHVSRSTNHASYKICHSSLVSKDKEKSFLEAEELGVSQPKRCDTCKHCTRCSHRAEHMTKKEAAELVMIEQNVTLDPASKNVKIRYPAKGDLSQMKDNRGQALGCATSLERKLAKDKTRKLYNDEFQGYVDRRVFKELSKDEMEA